MLTLLVLSILAFGANTDPTCNSIHVYDAGAPETLQFGYPTDACMASDVQSGTFHESFMFVCNANDEVEVQHFDNFDCAGTPSILEPCEWLYDGIEVQDCVYTSHCGLPLCSYHFVENWEGVTQCDGDEVVAYASYSKHAFLFDDSADCETLDPTYSVDFTMDCDSDDDVLDASIWFQDNCAGDPHYTFPLYGKGCDVGDGWAQNLICDVTHSGVSELSACGAAGGSFSLGHSCQCQDECSGEFCRAIDIIETSLQEAVGGSCETGICCCSCRDCTPFHGYLN
eukprot:185734_1